jgi:hypothetical protein
MKKDIEITITIEASTPSSHHKIIVTPSVAVNPPAFQYYKGIQTVFNFHDLSKKEKPIDNRLIEMIGFIVLMLSSTEYPNPQICSKTKATKIAKLYLPNLLKKLKNCEKVSKTFFLSNIK